MREQDRLREETARRIRELQKSSGEKQEVTAHQLGMNVRTFQKYQNGESMVSAIAAVRIAHHFGVSVEWLLGFVDEHRPVFTSREILNCYSVLLYSLSLIAQTNENRKIGSNEPYVYFCSYDKEVLDFVSELKKKGQEDRISEQPSATQDYRIFLAAAEKADAGGHYDLSDERIGRIFRMLTGKTPEEAVRFIYASSEEKQNPETPQTSKDSK